MKACVEKIPEKEFYKLNTPVLFSDRPTSRCFGVITNGNQIFRISWQSDLIMPTLIEIDFGVFGVGIDQNLSIINFNSNSVLLNLRLTYNFLTFQLYEKSILVITELEIMEINRYSFKVTNEFPLPDIFNGIELRGNKLVIKCAEGKNIVMSPPT